jgi:hypothetical protein
LNDLDERNPASNMTEEAMRDDKHYWMKLCEEAADTKDAKKLAKLILQINYILEVKTLRLKGEHFSPRPKNVEVDVGNLAL